MTMDDPTLAAMPSWLGCTPLQSNKECRFLDLYLSHNSPYIYFNLHLIYHYQLYIYNHINHHIFHGVDIDFYMVIVKWALSELIPT